jgi:hypothetical protein
VREFVCALRCGTIRQHMKERSCEPPQSIPLGKASTRKPQVNVVAPNRILQGYRAINFRRGNPARTGHAELDQAFDGYDVTSVAAGPCNT